MFDEDKLDLEMSLLRTKLSLMLWIKKYFGKVMVFKIRNSYSTFKFNAIYHLVTFTYWVTSGQVKIIESEKFPGLINHIWTNFTSKKILIELSSNLLDNFQESSSQIFVEVKVLDDFDPEKLEDVRWGIFQLRKSLAEINIFGQKGDLKITSLTKSSSADLNWRF